MEQLADRSLPQGMGYEWSGISLEQLQSGAQDYVFGDDPADNFYRRFGDQNRTVGISHRQPNAHEQARRKGILGDMVGAGIGAQEVGDDLHFLSKETIKKSCFGSSVGDSPGSGAVLGQASIALCTLRVAHHKCSASRRWCDLRRGGWRLNSLRRGMEFLEKRAHHYLKIVTTDESFLRRTRGVGTITHDQALLLGTVGPSARASVRTRA